MAVAHGGRLERCHLDRACRRCQHASQLGPLSAAGPCTWQHCQQASQLGRCFLAPTTHSHRLLLFGIKGRHARLQLGSARQGRLFVRQRGVLSGRNALLQRHRAKPHTHVMQRHTGGRQTGELGRQRHRLFSTTRAPAAPTQERQNFSPPLPPAAPPPLPPPAGPAAPATL